MSQYAKDRPADDTPFQRMRYYLREIGQGPKNCRDLNREEARDAMELILGQQVARSQMGGFLLVERFKGESADELSGFTEAIRARARIISPSVEGLLDVGSPYDGRKKSIVVSPAASIVTAAAGVPVVMHGERGMPPKHGVAVGDVLEAMGVDVDAEPDVVQRSIEELGFGYMRSARFVPDVYALKDLREEIALRSAISTIEKMYNLAGAAYSLIGLTHVPYLEKLLDAVKQMGFRRIMIIQGIEGNEDAPTARPCRLFEIRDGEMQEYRLNPQDYGLTPAGADEMAGGDAGHSAAIAVSVLAGEGGAHRDLVALNAGLRIYLAERAATIAEGITLARAALDSGAAREVLEALRARVSTRQQV